MQEYNLSSNLALSHCLIRTSKLLYWKLGMEGTSDSYLSGLDQDNFLQIIIGASED